MPYNYGPLEPWTYTGGPAKGDELARYMDERLRALEHYLMTLSRAVNHGPMPGAYFPITLRADPVGAANLAIGDLGGVIITNFEMTPRYISGEAYNGDITLQVTDGTDDLLVAPLDTALAEPWYNTTAAFTTTRTRKPAYWQIRVETVTGSPKIAQVIIVFSHVSKVDDPQI